MVRQTSSRVSISSHTPRNFKRLSYPLPARLSRLKVDSEQLRIFIGSKAIFIIMAMALMLMFTPYVLIGFMTPEESQMIYELHHNPRAMEVLLLIITAKMVGLGSIFTCLPLVKRFFFNERAENVVSFEKAPDRERLAPLTLTQRVVLTHGVVVHGRVLEVRWPAVTVRYKGPWGERHTARLMAHPKGKTPPRAGQALELLIDPQSPGDVVAPELLDIVFDAPPAFEDCRPVKHPHQDVREPVMDDERAQVPLRSTLRPIEPPMLLTLSRSLTGRRTMTTHIGALSIERECLRYSLEQRPGELVLSLERPFAIELSVWLTSDEHAELNVSLRRRGADLSQPSLCFRVEMPQQWLSRDLPTKHEERHPYLALDDFHRLWATLRFHATIHGEAKELLAAVALPDRLPEEFKASVLEAKDALVSEEDAPVTVDELQKDAVEVAPVVAAAVARS